MQLYTAIWGLHVRPCRAGSVVVVVVVVAVAVAVVVVVVAVAVP